MRGAPGVFVPWPEAAAVGEFAGLAKVAALGIKVTHARSYHGVALNVSMDLAPFTLINPCGYAGLPTIDLASVGVRADRAAVAAVWRSDWRRTSRLETLTVGYTCSLRAR